MLGRARLAVRDAGLANIDLMRAAAEKLPIQDGSVDVAMVNGIFNLNLSRTSIFRELGRVVRPGGVAYAAEIILKNPLPPDQQSSEDNWFA